MPPPFDLLPRLIDGLWITLQLAGGGIALAIILSIAAGLGRLSRIPPVKWIAVAYIEVFRGTSALVQLFWFFYVLPYFGVDLSAMMAGILVLGLNSGSYGAEVVRGTVLDVPRAQIEAATALNLTPRQTLWRVVLPQALPTMIPPFNNIFIELLKNTALVSLITLAELTYEAQLVRADTLRTAELFFLVLLLYFAVALAITGIMRLLERWAGRGMARGGGNA